jgi:hypothetical protein
VGGVRARAARHVRAAPVSGRLADCYAPRGRVLCLSPPAGVGLCFTITGLLFTVTGLFVTGIVLSMDMVLFPLPTPPVENEASRRAAASPAEPATLNPGELLGGKSGPPSGAPHPCRGGGHPPSPSPPDAGGPPGGGGEGEPRSPGTTVRPIAQAPSPEV